MRTDKFKNLQQVKTYYNFLLNKTWKIDNNLICLTDKDYFFTWDNAKRRFGQITYSKKRITISKPIILLNLKNGEELSKVFLHEIAHCIQNELYHVKSHNKQWKKILLTIGGDGIVQYDSNSIITPKGKYTLTCPNTTCKHKIERYKFPKKVSSCGKCDTKFNKNKIFVITKNY